VSFAATKIPMCQEYAINDTKSRSCREYPQLGREEFLGCSNSKKRKTRNIRVGNGRKKKTYNENEENSNFID
jgi:hypothetical protein